jgi:DNA modification methylase
VYLIELRDAFTAPTLGAWPIALIWTDPPYGMDRPSAVRALRENWGRGRPHPHPGAGIPFRSLPVAVRVPEDRSERSREEILGDILANTEPGDLVVDPFCGTGTTGVVALANGRNFYGCDTDPEMVRRTKARLATGVDPG